VTCADGNGYRGEAELSQVPAQTGSAAAENGTAVYFSPEALAALKRNLAEPLLRLMESGALDGELNPRLRLSCVGTGSGTVGSVKDSTNASE